jgi:hypothetical protein
MIFRYDFGNKLDLNKFKSQSTHYITYIKKMEYHLFIKNYKLIAEVSKSDISANHQINISIYDVIRDANGDILNSQSIIPLTDARFKELKEIINIFPESFNKGNFDASDSKSASDKICRMLNILFKLDKMKAFI